LEEIHSFIHRQPHLVQRALVILCIGSVALIAAKTLEAVSMLSEPLALTLAIVAGHCGFPLKTTAFMPDNEFAGSSRLRL
jgi:hypothetical protein